MNERWKPGYKETYYCIFCDGSIGDVRWLDAVFDKTVFELGNCFKTKEEAQSAAKKVMALLLSLHDNSETLQASIQDKQLPKLTAEVFDRPDCPEWAKYAAVDGNGYAYYYSERPFILSDKFGWGIVCGENSQSELIPGKFTHINWSESRIERPATLPDWCKVGEWVYLSNAKYYKIEGIRFDGGLILSDGVFLANRDIHAESVPARLRPYNAEEMRGLVGKVIEDTRGNVSFAVGFRKNDPLLYAGSNQFTAEQLLKDGFICNGKPCGKIEHLENGEWVE